MSTTSIDRMAQASRQRLYEVMADESRPLQAKQRAALEIGCDVLGVENGHIERIVDPDTHEITVSVGASSEIAPEGATFDRATTYCRRTIERDSPLALANAPEEGWADDPAYETHGLDCYLGTTLLVDGETYGTVCFVSREARPEAFGDGERMFIELLARLLGREIESQQRAEALSAEADARRASEEKYEALMNAAPAALFVADLETGKTVEVNDRATDLVGYTEAELVGLPQAKLHPPDQRSRYQEELDRLFAADRPLTEFADGTPLRFRHKDGTDIPVEISTSLVTIDGDRYVQGLVRDISDRRERQEELRVKNRAMDEASVGITIADVEADDLPLIYANEAFEEMTGYSIDHALGRNCRFLQGPETQDDSVEPIRNALEQREPVTAELVNHRADGTPFWNELTVTPVRDQANELTHFVGIQRDVTERKRRERLLSLLNRVLRHNLRNDMNVVLGYAELLADQLPDEYDDRLQRITETARDLSAMGEKAQTIEDIVRSPAAIEERDLVPIVHGVAAELEAAYPHADIEVRTPDTITAAVTSRFGTALYELGENAIIHGSDAPEVDFEITAPEPGYVEIEVRDNGPGLPSHERSVLETGRETPLEHGDSIGLWIVKWMVTDLGGEMEVEADTAGTSVRIQLVSRIAEVDAAKPALISKA